MKRLKLVIHTVYIFTFCVILQLPAKAQKYDPLVYMDSVEFSLLTCSPHEEVYSLYGHTALRYRDLHQGKEADFVFNWGVFNFNAPHFVARFVFGLTDYELEMAPFSVFCKYYQHWGSSVTEQVLNLTAEEKLALNVALEENYQPENRVYRYNYFYDNCSTRPRDIIERSISGKVVYEARNDYKPSFREMIHEKTRHHDWAKFGNDLLLGLKADFKTTREEQEFLPDNLLYDFDHAVIQGSDGNYRPLVKERRMPVQPGVQSITPDFFCSPTACFTFLFVATLLIAAVEMKRQKTFPVWDAVLMLCLGLAGCVLFVMIFSQHPTTSLNLQLLLLNPVHLFYIPSVLKRRAKKYKWLLLAMVCLYLLGGLIQHYAEGWLILALCLLTRIGIHIKNEK